MVDQGEVRRSVRVLREGGVCVLPTDTVWGVGASIDRVDAVERLYKIKRRAADKPTAVLVEGIRMASRYGKLDEKALDLAKRYWPGALTLVVRPRADSVPVIVQGGSGAVGLRAPDQELVLAILHELGAGIVAGSANFSGDEAPATFDAIGHFLQAADYVVGGVGPDRISSPSLEAGGLMPSTVVDVTKKPFLVLRQGPVRIGE